MWKFLRVEGKWLVLPLLILVLTHYAARDYPANPPDDVEIGEAATALVSGQGFESCIELYFPLCQEGDPTAAKEPLPVILFAFQMILDERIGVSVLALNTFLNLCTGVLIYLIALRLFEDRRVGLISVLLWAIYWPVLKDAAFVRSEPLFSLLIALTMLTLLHALASKKAWQFILVGVFLGLGILTRSTLFYGVFFVPVGYFLWNDRNWKHTLKVAALIFVPLLIVVLPWLVRNYEVFDRVFLSSTLNGYNLYRHNHIVTNENFIAYGDAWLTRENTLADIEARPDVYPDGLNEVQMNAIYMDRALEAIRAHPFRYIRLVAVRYLLFQWFDYKVAAYYGYQGSPEHLLLILSASVLLVGSIWGMVRLPRQCWQLAWPLFGMVIYLSTLHPLVVTMSRYMVPVTPYMMIFTAYWLTLFAEGRSRAVLRGDFLRVVHASPLIILGLALIVIAGWVSNAWVQKRNFEAALVTPLSGGDVAGLLMVPNDDGQVPCGVFDVGEHGFRIALLSDYPACSGQDLSIFCLNGEGQWGDSNVSNLAVLPADDQIQFISGQQGTCGIFSDAPAGASGGEDQ